MESTTPTPKKHGIIARTFHWGFILVFIYALTKQLDDVSQLADTALLRFEMLFAGGFLILLAARFLYMRFTQPSALPDETHPWMKLAARAGHVGLYASLASIAISGMLIGLLYSIGGANAFMIETVAEIHGFTVVVTYAVIALHIAAALFHRLKGDGIWSSMVPVWTEK